MCNEFGIVTGPAGQHIPDTVYDMPELQNNPDGGSRPTKRRRVVSTRPKYPILCISECEGVLPLMVFSHRRTSISLTPRTTRRRRLRMRTMDMITMDMITMTRMMRRMSEDIIAKKRAQVQTAHSRIP